MPCTVGCFRVVTRRLRPGLFCFTSTPSLFRAKHLFRLWLTPSIEVVMPRHGMCHGILSCVVTDAVKYQCLLEKKTPEKETDWKTSFQSTKSVSAAGLQGKDSHERSCIYPDASISQCRPASQLTVSGNSGLCAWVCRIFVMGTWA